MTWDQDDMKDWREVLRNESEKWDGYTQTLGQLMTSAYRQVFSVYELVEENTRIGATLWVCAKIFEIISVHKINTYTDYAENPILITLCRQAGDLFFHSIRNTTSAQQCI